jgi:hypothetical protein
MYKKLKKDNRKILLKENTLLNKQLGYPDKLSKKVIGKIILKDDDVYAKAEIKVVDIIDLVDFQFFVTNFWNNSYMKLPQFINSNRVKKFIPIKNG